MMNHQKLHCYQHCLAFIKTMTNVMPTWPSGLSVLKDQIRRALISSAMNIGEGSGKLTGRDQSRYYAIARGSLQEVSAGLDVAHAMGVLCEVDHRAYQDTLLSIVKMLTRLIQVTRV